MLLTKTYNNNLLNDVFDTFLNLPKEFTTDYKVEGDDIKMTFDVPGFSKEDFKITAENSVLHINAEVKNRKFNKQFKIDNDFNLSKTEATVKNGVLDLTIPKFEKKKKKFFEIKVG